MSLHRSRTALSLAMIAGALLLSACGDEIPPPTADSIAAVGSTSLQGFTDTELAQPVRVRVVGTDGNPFAGQSVSWAVTSGGGAVASSGSTTDDSGIATAQWTLGPAAGSNTLTATAAGLGSVTFEATASFRTLTPVVDIPIQGDIDVERVGIPAGVTVTLTGPTTIRSAGAVEIAGTLIGDCHELEIVGGAGGTFAGEVSNACVNVTVPGPGPDLTIIVDGPLDYSGQAVTTGDLFLSNSPTISPATFEGLALGASAVAAAGAPAVASAQATPCTLTGVFGVPIGIAMPGAAPGQPGMNGQNVRVGCNGAAVIDGAFFNAGPGGAAGDGDEADGGDQGPITANGANGGDGGKIDLWFEGDVDYDGAVLRLNAGGNGSLGNAIARADGQSAEARGGDGGDGGGLRVRAGGQMTIGPDGLEIHAGAGGAAGDANAEGKKGRDANGQPAQRGGSATARGGDGGDTTDGTLSITGGVVLQGDITVVPARAGNGGKATAIAGDGGNGAETQGHQNGAEGGNMAAVGGKGGNDETRVNGLAGGIAGNGGDILLGGGNGGAGFDFCAAPADGPGGDGGDGGDVRSVDGERSRPGRGGRSGQRGTDGLDGTWEVRANTGLGGDGGDGEVSAGSGGTRGGDTDLNRAFAGVMNDPTFEGGADANRCNTGPRLTAPDPNPSTQPDTPVDIEVGYDDLGGDDPDLQGGWLVTELGAQGSVTNPQAVIDNGRVVGITFTFTPAPGFEGRATFKVAVKDVLGGESSPVQIDVDVASIPASETLVITTGSTNAAESVIRYDVDAGAFKSSVPAPAEARGLVPMPDGTMVAVTATGAIVRFDPETGMLVSDFGTAGTVNDAPGLFGGALVNGSILLTNAQTGELVVVSPSGMILNRIDLGPGIEMIEAAPDGSKVFIFDRNDPADILDDELVILDGISLQVVDRIGAFLLLDMEISPDGSLLVFTSIAGSDPNTGDPVLGYQGYDLDTMQLLDPTPVPVWEAGFGSGGVWFAPDGGVFYLTDPANGRALAYDPDDGEAVESRDITNVPVQDFRIILWTADLLRRVFLGPFSFVIQDVATGVFGPQVAIPDLMFALLAGAF